ncbi:phage head-tail joining protein [Oceaniovalibus sp. ACAM 378]|uniref:phage head-tail joining protein n=1 Tax=Oceaniovalibus sp. ACAM 378 TaxID=2599923 RepID=UPI0011D6FA54|nr:hypothetical protein [Oceaniovalibus sp. ACAM 378]TYB83962.1 hypothetical protein FQ320_23370 [Oceaniovalibus sp. ACAM 378]
MSGYTQQQLDDLRSMTAKGITKGSMGGESVEFRSLADMFRLIAVIERSLAPTATVRQHFPTFRRGT